MILFSSSIHSVRPFPVQRYVAVREILNESESTVVAPPTTRLVSASYFYLHQLNSIYPTNMLPEDSKAEDRRVLNSDLLKSTAKFSSKWTSAESSECLISNRMVYGELVTGFEVELDSRPSLAPEVRCFPDLSSTFSILNGSNVGASRVRTYMGSPSSGCIF